MGAASKHSQQHLLSNSRSKKLLEGNPGSSKSPDSKRAKSSYNEDDVVQFWGCCGCGFQASLSVRYVYSCVECFHKRCANCLFEYVVIGKDRDSILYRNAHDVSNSLSFPDRSTEVIIKPAFRYRQVGKTAKKLPAVGSKRSTSSSQGDKNGPITVNNDEKDCGRVRKLHDEFIDNAGEDDDEAEIEVGFIKFAIKVLESRLLTAFEHDLDLAGSLLPKIYHKLRLGELEAETKSTPAGANQTASRGSRGSQQPSSSSLSGPTQGAGSSRKRSRKKNEGDKRPRRQNFKPMQEAAGHNPVTWACHFFKFDAVKYGPESPEENKFRRCVSTKISDFRRIKDHFTSIHLTGQCDSCFGFFHDADEQVRHVENLKCYPTSSMRLKDGITINQWKKIERVIASKGGKHHYEKWYEIWDILHPGAERPSNPYSQLSTLPQKLDIEAYRERYRRIIRFDVRNGTLPRDDPFVESYLRAVDQLLHEIATGQIEVDADMSDVFSSQTLPQGQGHSQMGMDQRSLPSADVLTPPYDDAESNFQNSDAFPFNVQCKFADAASPIMDQSRPHQFGGYQEPSVSPAQLQIQTPRSYPFQCPTPFSPPSSSQINQQMIPHASLNVESPLPMPEWDSEGLGVDVMMNDGREDVGLDNADLDWFFA